MHIHGRHSFVRQKPDTNVIPHSASPDLRIILFAYFALFRLDMNILRHSSLNIGIHVGEIVGAMSLLIRVASWVERYRGMPL